MTTEHQIFTFVLILARVSSFIAFFPLFGQKQLPTLVKSGLAVGLTIFWYGSLSPEMFVTTQVNVVTSVLFLCKEIGIGFLIAVVLGFMFVPAKIAGAYVGQEVGLSLASVSSPGSMDSSTLVTTIFETLAVLLFFGLNMHHFLIVFLHVSLTELAGKIDLFDLPTEMFVNSTNALSEYGMLIVGPIGIVMFVLTVGLALLNKAAPTLNLFSVGMGLRSGLGIFCMFIFMPVIIKSMEMYFLRYQSELEMMAVYFE